MLHMTRPTLFAVLLCLTACAPDETPLPHSGAGIVLTEKSSAGRFNPDVLDGPAKTLTSAAAPLAARWADQKNGVIHLSVFAADNATAQQWGTALAKALQRNGVPRDQIVMSPMLDARQPAGVIAAWTSMVASTPGCPDEDDRFDPDIRCRINKEIAASASNANDLAGRGGVGMRGSPESTVDVGGYQTGTIKSDPGILKDLGLSSTGGKL